MPTRPSFSISLMCMDFLNMRPQLETLNKRAQMYHVDIMDGHFAPNITLSPDFMRAVSTVARLPMDTHLMTTDPNRWIDAAAEAGASVISPHAETINTDAFRTYNRIRALGCKQGVVLNPATPLSTIEHYIDRIDMLTIMTVDVGFAGQPFIEQMLRKIERAREMKEKYGYRYAVQVDGSCNAASFKKLWDAGAEVFVLGTSGLFALDEDTDRAYDKMLVGFKGATDVDGR